MKRLYRIEFLRGFLIFTVVMAHLIIGNGLPKIIDAAASFGGAGVHVFLLVSGFGLY